MVGALDAALLWPLVTLAARREAGDGVGEAVRRGKLWSGARTAATMLTPYCVAVEGITTSARRAAGARSEWERAALTPAVSFLVAGGLQPVEKKLVLEQLLQQSGAKQYLSLRDMLAYVRQPGGFRALWGGFLPLWARETVYIGAVTVLNPLAAAFASGVGSGVSVGVGPVTIPAPALVSSFVVGFSAGMVTAPLQTINVVLKDERNRGRARAWAPLFSGGWRAATRRLFFGSVPRSTRTGLAGVLWYLARDVVNRVVPPSYVAA